jgi:hypothetical protein
MPPGWLAEAASALTAAAKDMARAAREKEEPVDEYRSNNLAGDSELTFRIFPQFERKWVLIDHILITGPPSQSLGQPYENSAAAPAANGLVLNISAVSLPPPGDYLLSWKVGLDGTVTDTTDDNNMKLTGPPAGGTLQTATFPGAIGQYAQTTEPLTIPQGNAQALQVKAIAASTAGSVYSAQIVLTPNGGNPVQLQLGDRVFNMFIPPTGVLELSPKRLMLSPQHDRIFTATFAGEYTVELTGNADVRNR